MPLCAHSLPSLPLCARVPAWLLRTQALELAAGSRLSDEDLADEGTVRAKVRDLIKLGEMRWRYRVVDEGQSPKVEAIAVLEEAKGLIERHLTLASRRGPPSVPLGEGSVGAGERGGAGGGVSSERSERSGGVGSERGGGGGGGGVPVCSVAIPKKWGGEMSEVLQGLALARLIFNSDRTEDVTILALLREVRSLGDDDCMQPPE